MPGAARQPRWQAAILVEAATPGLRIADSAACAGIFNIFDKTRVGAMSRMRNSSTAVPSPTLPTGRSAAAASPPEDLCAALQAGSLKGLLVLSREHLRASLARRPPAQSCHRRASPTPSRAPAPWATSVPIAPAVLACSPSTRSPSTCAGTTPVAPRSPPR